MKIRLLLTLTALLLALSSWADGTEIDRIHYELDSSTKTASVTYTGSSYDSDNSYSGDITIPASVNYSGTTYSVTSIGGSAFRGCTGLTSITIPSSLTSIGSYAFYGCTGLTSITIPSSVTSIGWYAFYNCTGLTSITIPESVTSIGGSAFYGCTGLTSITIPNSVTSIGWGAFYGCTGLTSITIPNSVTSIGKEAFYGCKGLTSITIPSSVRSIGDSAFRGCTGLTSITIPSSVTSIGERTFYNCTGLTSITIPSSVTSIGVSAFYGCKGLTSITISNSVTSIGEWAFSVCTGLKSVTIPSSVTSIGDRAFRGCTGLTSITIPSSVTSIGREAFYNCKLNPLIIYGDKSSMFASSYNSSGTKYTTFDGLKEGSVVYVQSSLVNNVRNYTSLIDVRPISGEPTLNVIPYIQGVKIMLANPLEAESEPTITSVKVGSIAIEGLQANVDTLITGLKPSTTYTIELTYLDGEGESKRLSKSFTTKSKSIYDYSYSRTQTTAQVYYIGAYSDITTGKVIATGYAMGSSDYTEDDIFYSNETVTGLTPNTKYEYYCWAMYADSTLIERGPFYFTTRGVSPSVGVNVTPTTATIKSVYTEGDAHVNSAVLTFGGTTITDGQLTGLKPNTKYTVTYTVKTQEGSTETVNKEFTTAALTMTTQQPKVISAGNVIVAAETNLDEAETNVGFEWRRTDWTDDFASNSGAAYLYGGTMEGYIRNLYTEKLWKYRPYYEASDGTRYYGDWVGLDPTNTSYFEPTVHTYATINVQSNTASVKGYAMRGTDNVAQQGFKYWKVSSSTRGIDEAGSRLMAVDIPTHAQTITASGQVMTATLTNLEYASDYCCVAFVTTTEGETFYGELQTFRTGEDVTGIGHVIINAADEANGTPTIVGYYNLQGQRIAEPQKGIVIVRYSDGTSRKMYVR